VSAATDPQAPVSLWGAVVGQDQAVARLDAAVESPVHAYLFVGPPGSTKREAARAFAAALLCDQRGCGHCRACRLALAGGHPDLREVERVGASITADQAREIVRLATLTPVEGRRKVLVLHEFHLLQPAAAAVLLKTIEEPPESTVFVVLADDVPPELVTIASRCVRIDFRAVPDPLVAARLVDEGANPDAAAVAAKAAAGDLDRARILVGDAEVQARHDAFHRLPQRLDGSGHAVAAAVDELLGLIDGAAEPVKVRQAGEVAALDARVEQLGERGAGRRDLTERHKRELRRHRIDELKAGLVALAAAYRDRLADGTAHDPAGAVAAVVDVHEVIESLERNPNESLQLQALLLRLPSF
jgi:DNA polymerase-3 subunit delta'